MRRKVQKVLKLAWKEAMEAELPDFEPYSAEVMPDTFSCWRGKIGEITCFVTLHPHTKEDIFTIDIAWSRHGFLHYDAALERKDAEEIRLARLWDTTSQSDPWWEIEPRETWEEMNQRLDAGHFFREEMPVEECLLKVPLLVQDAMGKLKEFGIPFLEKKAREA